MINAAMEIFNRLFTMPTKNSYVQFFRYGFVAAASLVVDFGGMVFLKEVVGMHYIVAATFSFVAGLLTNYYLSRLWVFHSSKLEDKRKEFMIFSAIGIIGLLLTDGLLWLFTDVFGVYYMLSKAIATILVYFWNFGARKKILFN